LFFEPFPVSLFTLVLVGATFDDVPVGLRFLSTESGIVDDFGSLFFKSFPVSLVILVIIGATLDDVFVSLGFSSTESGIVGDFVSLFFASFPVSLVTLVLLPDLSNGVGVELGGSLARPRSASDGVRVTRNPEIRVVTYYRCCLSAEMVEQLL